MLAVVQVVAHVGGVGAAVAEPHAADLNQGGIGLKIEFLLYVWVWV